MKVYVVEDGDYSDRRVCGIFSTKKKAKEFSLRFNEDRKKDYYTPYITEWEVDKQGSIPPDMNIYGVHLDLFTADVHQCFFTAPVYEVKEEEDNVFGCWWGALFQIYCIARDRNHAIKVANERLAVWKARNPSWFSDYEEIIQEDIKREIDFWKDEMKYYRSSQDLEEREKIFKAMQEFKKKGLNMDGVLEIFNKTFEKGENE